MNFDYLSDFLEQYTIEELKSLISKLNIDVNYIEDYDDLDEFDLSEVIIENSDDFRIVEACLLLFEDDYEDFLIDYDLNNSWRYSDYGNKDIDDWDADDHLAAWYDHMMEK